MDDQGKLALNQDATPPIQVDELLEDLRQRWAQGEQVRVEEYLDRYPRLVSQEQELLDLLYQEMVLREGHGESPTLADYLVRFPNLESELRVQFEIERVMDGQAVEPDSRGDQSLADTVDRDTVGGPPKSTLPRTIAHREMPLDEPVSSDAPSESFGDYELLEEIARGGMGVVYKARQTKANRLVALKMILAGNLASREEIDRFYTEAEAAANLDHPHIVPVYDVGQFGGRHYFSMAYVEGKSLADVVREQPLEPRDAAKLTASVTEAVEYAHQRQIVHRDLKPSNILLDSQGVPRVTDFGLAKRIEGDSGLTATGNILGTPSYMPPEQAKGQTADVGPLADVYSLGALLYHLVTGRPPFRAATVIDTLQQVIHQEPVAPRQLNPVVDQDLNTVILKTLEKDPARRYASAKQLREELDRYLDGRPVLARPVSSWTRLNRWRKRNPAIAGLLLAVLVSLLAGTGISSYFAVLARSRAATAEAGIEAATEQSQLALKAIRTVIHTVQERLKEIPEAREVRRELLLEVLADLEKVATGYLAQSSVDRESAQVFAELGTLFSEIGDETGANTEELSGQYFRKSIEIYNQLVADHPGDQELRTSLIVAARDYGDLAREYREFEQAVWAHRIARTHAIRWHDEQPDNPNSGMAYVQTTEALGEALIRTSAGFDEGRKHCVEALKLAKKHCEIHPSTGASEVLALCYTTVGDMHRVANDLDAAETAYREMCDVTLRLMKQEPDNPQRIFDRSCDFERLGDLYMARKDHEKARESYEECLRLCIEYAEDDPTNLYRLQQSTWGYQKVAQICQVQGDHERAKWAREKLKEVQSRLTGQAVESSE